MQQVPDFDVDAGPGLQVEHICLESEQSVVMVRTRAARSGATFRFVSRLHGSETELAFTTDRRLSVRLGRRRAPLRHYAVDLRFIDAESVAARRIPWGLWLNFDLRSVHGGARLARVIGSLGSAREMREFIAELARRVGEARRQAAQSRQHFLRDEMREHHRLWSEGVLTAANYESSKRRILAAHT